MPTRIYALFDYPPEYGLASALSLLFVMITVVALYLQRAFLARRSYVTLGGKGRPAATDEARPGALAGVRILPCSSSSVAIVLPYTTLIAV